MRVSQKEKERSHQRIVEGAARLIRERGIETTSVSDVMTDAGMTIGGFYKHFDSKDALAEAALRSAFDEMIGVMTSRLGAEAALADYQSFYLSEGHVGSPGIGCPVAALSGDVARGPASLKAEFGAGVRRTIATLVDSMPGTADERVAAATRRLALLAGAVLIARASDPDTGRAVLSAAASTPADP